MKMNDGENKGISMNERQRGNEWIWMKTWKNVWVWMTECINEMERMKAWKQKKIMEHVNERKECKRMKTNM